MMKGKIKLQKKVTWGNVKLRGNGQDYVIIGFFTLFPLFNFITGLMMIAEGLRQRKVTWEQI